MQGGYNIHPLIDALDDAKLAPIAAKALSHTLLMFDNFYDVEEKAKRRQRICEAGYAVLGGCRMVPESPGAG